MKTHHAIFLLLLLPHFPSISSVKYQVTNKAKNTPGGSRFDSELGIPYTLQIMKTTNLFIWDIFQQLNQSDQKYVSTVNLSIVNESGYEAVTRAENINVSSIYLEEYKGNLTRRYTSLLYHEMVHVFQWNGEGNTPVGLVEGIADYVVLKSNHSMSDFAKPGKGKRWNEGYDITARFLEYCEELKSGFVAWLNKKMRRHYSESYFEEFMGKPVVQLWAEYKAKYSHHNG